jgi:lactate/malate dehydrogenase, alpha/beta C-terminal domain
VILIATDPPEPLVDIARHLAGHDRVLNTSTYLDSLRFRVHLAERLGVSPACVDAYVVGEHGTWSVFLWSSARIGGMRVLDMLTQRRIGVEEFRQAVEQDVRYANISIVEGIGASQYGIGGGARRRSGSKGRAGRVSPSARTTRATASRCHSPASSGVPGSTGCSGRRCRTTRRAPWSAAPRS